MQENKAFRSTISAGNATQESTTRPSVRAHVRLPALNPALSVSAPLGPYTGTLLTLLGIGVIARDYALILPRPANYVYFWLGVGLCLLGASTLGLRHKAGCWEHLYALAALGGALWLPYYLRSPSRLIFQDELYHYQIVQLMLEQGHTHVPVTFFPIPGEFPGLELSTLSLMATSGLPINVAVRIMTLIAHVLIPLLMYLIGRGLGLGRRSSFVAALVYLTNTSYFFFHSIFSYETLGIVLVLSLWALLVRNARRIGRSDFVLVTLVLFATAVTHHASSYVLSFTLAIAWLIKRLLTRSQRGGLGTIAMLSVLMPIAWLKLSAVRAAAYLANSFSYPIRSALYSFQHHTSRHLFSTSTLPAAERIVDRLYPVLLLLLGLTGIYIVFRRAGWRRAPYLLVSLAIPGPLLWIATAPIILTPGSNVVFRAWPFLMVGMATYCALAIRLLTKWLDAKSMFAGQCATFVIIALLLVGGIGLGDNQAGRFKMTHPQSAAGPEDITPDVISAARWLEHTAGRYHMMAADFSSETAFVTYGFQSSTGWGTWIPFLVPGSNTMLRYLQNAGVEYLITDQRVTKLPPRYSFFYGQEEIYELQEQGFKPETPFPAELLIALDHLNILSRIYDDGNIQIYRVNQNAVSRALQPPTLHHNGNLSRSTHIAERDSIQRGYRQ